MSGVWRDRLDGYAQTEHAALLAAAQKRREDRAKARRQAAREAKARLRGES